MIVDGPSMPMRLKDHNLGFEDGARHRDWFSKDSALSGIPAAWVLAIGRHD